MLTCSRYLDNFLVNIDVLDPQLEAKPHTELLHLQSLSLFLQSMEEKKTYMR